MLKKSDLELLEQAVAIEEQAAKEAGALGFMARAMVQATMPHSKPATNEYERRNGNYILTMWSPSKVGLPYGSIPRLLLAWISTEAVRTQDRTLLLGDNLSGFMRQLGMVPKSGRGDSTVRLKNQMERLFSCAISCRETVKGGVILTNLTIASTVNLWWDPKSPDQAALWDSTLKLNDDFYHELIRHPIPIDLRALKALKKSPLAIDVYCWLSYRMSYLQGPVVIPWALLATQFGADYNRLRAFKEAMGEVLRQVLTVYPGARAEPTDKGLKISPSKTHVIR